MAKIIYNGITTDIEPGKAATLPCSGKRMKSDVVVKTDEVSGGSALPIEVATEAEMTALLETAEVGSIYKYVGANGTYESGALYVVSELVLPEWNGNLTDTTWEIPSGWSATSGYGIFDIYGYINNSYFSVLSIGYSGGMIEGPYGPEGINRVQSINTICADDNFANALNISPSDGFTILFDDSTDVTNASLIAWLKANGNLTSHSMPTPTLISFTIDGTTYQAEEGMTWREFCGGATEATEATPIYTVSNVVYYACDSNGNYTGSGVQINGVTPSSVIVDGTNYELYKQIGGGSN